MAPKGSASESFLAPSRTHFYFQIWMFRLLSFHWNVKNIHTSNKKNCLKCKTMNGKPIIVSMLNSPSGERADKIWNFCSPHFLLESFGSEGSRVIQSVTASFGLWAGVARYIFGAVVFTVKHTFCPHLFDSFSSTETGLLNGPAMINTSNNNCGSVQSEIYQFTPYKLSTKVLFQHKF